MQDHARALCQESWPSHVHARMATTEDPCAHVPHLMWWIMKLWPCTTSRRQGVPPVLGLQALQGAVGMQRAWKRNDDAVQARQRMMWLAGFFSSGQTEQHTPS